MTFRLGELFCGPGGLSLGALQSEVMSNGELFNIEHVWSSDYDKDSCNTYILNIPNAHPDSVYNCDVKDLNIDNLPDLDAFAYGFPCNDFSIVGEQNGMNGRFGGLYSYGVKVLNRYNPRFFVAENVGGLLSANDGKAFRNILRDLRRSGDNGYELTVHKYRAEEYGVPQTRHRIIIVGINTNENLQFNVPAPLTPNKYEFKTVREALEEPPISNGIANNELTRQNANVVERLNHILPGQNAWNANLPPHLRLNVKGATLSQIYRRLHPDRPSYTITGSGGGGTHGYHYEEPRALTNRERARIQTFPDTFEFMGSKESVRKQIGMAVPPQLSNVIFNAILKTFARIEYDSVTPNMTI